jgi:lysyl-tRNA synthetase class 2
MLPKNDIERERLAKLQRLIESGVNPYPARVKRTHTTAQALAAFEADETSGSRVEAAVAGRLTSFRSMGKSSFGHIEDGAGRLQLYWRVNDVGQASYDQLLRDTDLGDFVQAEGFMFRTKTGEVSLHVMAWRVISKSIKPLPSQRAGRDGQVVRYSEFADTEQRYRERYADLAVHPQVRAVFVTRAKVVSALRRFSTSTALSKSRHPSFNQSMAARQRARSSLTIINFTRTCTCASALSCTSSGCSWADTSACTRLAATFAMRA